MESSLGAKKEDFSRKRIVCVVTGTGLKDPEIARRYAQPPLELAADLANVEGALGFVLGAQA